MVSSPTCTAKSSHDKDEKISTNIGQDQHITSNLLRDNVFRPPYDYSSLEMDENNGMYSGQQRNFPLPLHWEKNVEFLRDRAKKLSPKFVSNWSSRRVAYFVSTLPGISHHIDTARNGCTNDQGKISRFCKISSDKTLKKYLFYIHITYIHNHFYFRY